MKINHNISALNAYRNLSTNNANTAKSLERLSSGLRINSAADDAAGLAISEKMRSQIRGLDMSERNGLDAVSLIQTAEGALSSTHSILQRMRELAVQAANDTNTAQDRTNIQDEVDQLGKEIDRIRNTTQFNTKNLLDGSMDQTTVAAPNKNTNTALHSTTVAGDSLTAIKDAGGTNLGIAVGDTIDVSYVINGVTKIAPLVGGVVAGSKMSDIAALIGDGAASYSAAGIDFTANVAGYAGAINGLTITVKDSTGAVKSGATNAMSSFAETSAATIAHSDSQATFQIGANTGQSIQLAIEDMGTQALGVQNIKVGNQGQANVAIKAIDTAITKVSAERSKLGATQNRLEYTVDNLKYMNENITASESRIRDLDMALEMTNYTKNNILVQSAQAMLAQANQLPQGVLQLLK